MTVSMQEINQLMENFTSRLIQNGYRPESVKRAVAKQARMMAHSVLIDDITKNADCGECQVPRGCRKCPIHQEGATRRVPGHGNPSTPIMFVGEGPGEHEDLFGIPFIGIAGTALTLWLEKMPLKREQVYIANVLKCRPRNNRTPESHECRTCIETHLNREIKMIKPRVIVAVGAVALKALVSDAPGITMARGRWFSYQGIPLTAIFHPAYVLRKKNREFAEVNQQVYRDLMQAYSRLR